jgi:hypothetical protein
VLGTTWPVFCLSPSLFSISSAHHDGQRLWLIALSVGMPLPILMAPLHPNTMGYAPMRRFGRNQWWRRVIGGFCRSKFNQFFYTQQSTADMAASIACGAAIPNPHGAASSKHHGRCHNALVWLESMVGASNWGGSAKQIKSIFLHTAINWAMAASINCDVATGGGSDSSFGGSFGG